MSRLERHVWPCLVTAVAAFHTGCPSAESTGAGGASASSVPSSSLSSSSVASQASTAATASTGAGGCDLPPKPDGVPPGWVDYADWQCNKCRFYVPSSKTVLPPPIVWEKCPKSPAAIDCQSMVIDWTNSESAAGALMATVAGKPVLGLTRNAIDGPNPYFMHVIAEADGPVRSALISIEFPAPGCFLDLYAFQDGKVIYKVLGDDAWGKWATSLHKGAFGGSIDQLHPDLIGDYGQENSWACSGSRVYRETQSLTFYTQLWGMTDETFISSPATDPEKLQLGQPLAWGDSFFWISTSSYVQGINSWTSADGARPFIRYLGDATRGAGNLGTDGATMVWSYGEGKAPNDGKTTYPVKSILSSPFTTDPAKLVPKRLRSDPSGSIGGQAFRVACGRAAHGGKIFPVIIVRLSDGVSWTLPPSSQPDFYINDVIGLTCDHVYVYGEFGGRWNVARVKLDSLGPGMPPD